MKKWLLSLAVLTAGIALVPPAHATTALGLGYFRPEAPVGGRAWLNDKTAIDLGIGFALEELADVESDEPDDTTNKLSFILDAGVPFVVAGDESTKFFVRPGITFASRPVVVASRGGDEFDTESEFWVSGSLGVEHFFTKRFSLQAAHGVVFKSFSPAGDGDSTIELASEDFGISSIGFHFYFTGE